MRKVPHNLPQPSALEQQTGESLMTEAEKVAAAKARVAEIDAMFEDAKGWGSWMVMAANERERIADVFGFPHKYQARTASGGRTD